MTRAIVVGGGVAGPVVAMALQRVGIEATVHEAHAGPAGDVLPPAPTAAQAPTADEL